MKNLDKIRFHLFMVCLRYYNTLFSAKDLHQVNQTKTKEIVDFFNDPLIDLSDVDKKVIPQNENPPDEEVNIAEKPLHKK